MSYMTKVEGVPDRDDIRPGMAYFAGTGPSDKTCGSCKHRGLIRQSQKGKWNEALQQLVFRSYRFGGCSMFKKMTGNYGPVVKKTYLSCKYFEPSKK